MTYEEMVARVNAGWIVAAAPATTDDGEPSLVIVTGELPPVHRMYLSEASDDQMARIALRAVRQVREHYRI